MFGVRKEELVTGLARISCKLCGYLGSLCDCKYMDESNDHLNAGTEQTGCPEVSMAATLINAMTPQEFHAIAQRAGIQVHLSEQEQLDLEGTFEAAKRNRNTVLYGVVYKADSKEVK